MWAFQTVSVFDKIKFIRQNCDDAMKMRTAPARPSPDSVIAMPVLPGRDVLVLEAKAHPPKKGFAHKEGLARMLHDLASIELQAMELGLRSLVEFPEAPQGFRDELHAVTISESEHLTLCLEGIESLGFRWGDWPVHCGLWTVVDAQDSLLDRILIVHRYLEGSGLDAGDGLLRRLEGVNSPQTRLIVRRINTDEVGHVEFGSRWYREVCRLEGRDSRQDFPERMFALRERLPKRVEKVNRELRGRAGFTEEEIVYFENLREEFLIPYKVRLEAAAAKKAAGIE